MKITIEHYQILKDAIWRAKQGMETLDEYVNQHHLTGKRWRWDLLYRAKRLKFLPERFIEDTLYSYCNDEHIDTALRRCS